MPKISIIVPVYKVEKYLNRCLDSIVAQTFTDWECILVDDGSPDNSGKICDEYAEKDNRFRVFHQENQGVSAARNKGLDEAKGEWIGFVDSDDWIESNMYEYLYSTAIKTSPDVITCSFFGQYGKRIQKMCGKNEAIKLLFERKFGAFSVLKLITSEKIKNVRFDTTVSYMEDTLFFYNLFKNCDKIYWDTKPLYHYEINDDSATRQKGLTKQVATALAMLDNLYENEKDISIKEYIQCQKITIVGGFAFGYVKLNDLTNPTFMKLKDIVSQNLYKILTCSIFTYKIRLRTLILSFRPLYLLASIFYRLRK